MSKRLWVSGGFGGGRRQGSFSSFFPPPRPRPPRPRSRQPG